MHRGFHRGEVLVGELLPLRGEQQRLGVRDGLQRRAYELHLRGIEELPLHGLLRALRIVGRHMRALGHELVHQFDRHRVPHVVRVWFEGQAPHRDLLVLQDPERLAHLVDVAVELRLIDLLDLLQQLEGRAELLRDGDERLHVLRKTRPAVAEAGVEKVPPDPLIHADAVRHHLHVRARRLADCGDCVDVADLHGKERVRRVLDQFRRVHIGDEDRCLEGLVDALHQVRRLVGGTADHDAVGVHQIRHRAALAEELRV